jgi:hypothetical protein
MSLFARARGIAAICALVLSVVAGGSAEASTSEQRAFTAQPATCSGVFEGDPRLGPEHLPQPWELPIGPLMVGYDRTGGLPIEQFLATYWDANAGQWRYPPDEGFAVGPDGTVDKHPTPLAPGQVLDRFGSEYGSYLAPAGAPYAQRALPPQSLTTQEPTYPCGYHEYTVTKPFTVFQGRIAPWFHQRGGGQQILLDKTLLDPGPGDKLNVKWLLSHGYLKAGVGAAEPAAPSTAVAHR